MLIVLEGCDGVGKTFLAERLRVEIDKRFGPAVGEIVHHGVPTLDDMYEEYDLGRFYVLGTGQHVILDRWQLGEWVYGRLYRGGSQLGLRGVTALDKTLVSAGALRIILDASDWEVAERLEDKNEDYLKEEHQFQVLREYRILSQFLGWLSLTSDADPATLVDWAVSLEEWAIQGGQ